MTSPKFSNYFAVEAEGQRIGLMVCLRCGATILLGDANADGPKIHDVWHDKKAADGQ